MRISSGRNKPMRKMRRLLVSDGELTPLAAAAAGLHENMMAYVKAGFTREEALRIVIALLTETMRRAGGEGGL